MSINNTTLLGLAQPVTGQESGVWGDDVNNGLTELVEIAIAGVNNITQDSDITLAVSNGSNSSSFTSTSTNSTVAQYYVLNCSGSRTAARNIIVPTTSKTYVITNATTGGYAITIKKSGGTGVGIVSGETAIVFYNTISGDVAKISSNTITALVGILGTANGGTGLGGSTPFTANGVAYASSTSALATGSNLTWNGNAFQINSSAASYNLLTTQDTSTSYSFTNNFLAFYNSTSAMGGIGHPAANDLSIYALGNLEFGANNVEKMRLTSAGYLGIGTTTLTGQTTIASAIGTIKQLSLLETSSNYVRKIGADASGGMQFYSGDTSQATLDVNGNLGLGVTPSAWTSAFKVVEIGSKGGALAGASGEVDVFNNAYNNGSNYIYGISSYATQFQMNNLGQFRWYTAPSGTAGGTVSFTQAMTLDNSGNLLLGTTTANGKLYVTGLANSVCARFEAAATSGALVQCINTNTSGSNTAIFFQQNGSSVGSITTSNTTTTYNTSSDQRIKTNIVDAPNGNIDQIKIRSFDWKSDGSHNTYGVIAQELLEVAPYAVHVPTNPDEMMGVDYSKLVPMMIKEIQSLKAEVATLKGA